MMGRISESMTSEITLNLTERKHHKILLQDTGKNCALEVVETSGRYIVKAV